METIKKEVTEEIKDLVDMSGYQLTARTFATILPVLETTMFLGAKKIDLSGNGITDDSVYGLILALMSCHNYTLRSLDLS